MYVRSLLRKAEHLVLPQPFRWQVGEASNAHAVREPAVDGRFDEIRCEESQRDCHVDFSRAALFPPGDAVGTCRWISDEFIQPTTGTSNRCNQSPRFLAPVLSDVHKPRRGWKWSRTQTTNCLWDLFFAVLFEMSLHRLFRVPSAENCVAPSYVSVVCSLLVTSGLMMFGRFPMVASGMRQMF